MNPYRRSRRLPVHRTRSFILLLVLASLSIPDSYAQMKRSRANSGGPVDEIFLAPGIIGSASVTNIPEGNLNFTILHTFGIMTDGADDLFGLDAAANIRFGLDFGVSDRLSIGIGRSRFDKLFDVRFKAKLLRQTKDDRIPVEIAVKGDAGIMTEKNGYAFIDRLNYFGSVLIARRFSDLLSIQLTPMFSHFNTVFIERNLDNSIRAEENDHIALGIAARWVLSTRTSLLVEYLPVLGSRSDGTRDAFSVAYNIETGGHVFQLFLKTSQWLTEQHIIARNTDDFFDGDFRFGFNVNRVFSLGSQ